MNDKLRNKRMLSYYVIRRHIRLPNHQRVAYIDGEFIISFTPQFIYEVEDISKIKLDHPPIYDINKHRFYIVDGINNEIIAKTDESYNVFTLNNEYVGTFYSQLRILYLMLILLVLVLSLFSLSILGFKETISGFDPDKIIVIEENGAVIIEHCNIFYEKDSPIPKLKLLAPNRGDSYYFNVVNYHPFSVDVHFYLLEINEYNIPLYYRLVREKEWLSLDHQRFDKISYSFSLNGNETIGFRLDWLWQSFDDEFDTNLGLQGIVDYILYLVFEIST